MMFSSFALSPTSVGFLVFGLCVFGEWVDYLLLYDEY